MTIENALFAVQRRGVRYSCKGSELPSKLRRNDLLVVQREGVAKRFTWNTTIAPIQNDDLLACTDEDGVTKKVTGAQFRRLFIPPSPPEVISNPVISSNRARGKFEVDTHASFTAGTVSHAWFKDGVKLAGSESDLFSSSWTPREAGIYTFKETATNDDGQVEAESNAEVYPMAFPWEGHDGGIWHVKNLGPSQLDLNGGPYTAWKPDGTYERTISKLLASEEAVFITPANCPSLFKKNGFNQANFEFGEHTDTRLVTDMWGLFSSCDVFNSDVSRLDVSNVTKFGDMFFNATAFNQDLSHWDVSKAEKFFRMFYGTVAFNQDISGWNTSNASNMDYMFYNAKGFNQNLSSWCVSKTSADKAKGFSQNSGMPADQSHDPRWGTCPRGEDQN